MLNLRRNRFLYTISKYRYLFLAFLLFFLFFAAVEIKAEESDLDYITRSRNLLKQGAARDEAKESGKLHLEGTSDAEVSIYTGALVCHVLGSVGCTEDPNEINENFGNSVLGVTTQSIVLTYAIPPAGVGPFIADAAMRAGLVDKAWAQGIGFTSLTPLIPVWRAFRNATYAVMILVLLVFGVLIMLRRQIDPQTIITIQNSIPRIVVTLILITFSYAIAGFIIDLMYLVILFIISIFNSVGLIDISGVGTAQKLLTGGVPEFLRAAFSGIEGEDILSGGFFGAVGGALTPFLLGAAAGGGVGAVGGPIGIIAGILVGGLLSNYLTGDLTSPEHLLGAAVSPIAWFLMAIVFLFAFLRLLFMLISSYIQIIVNIVFAPLKLIADVVPGGEGFFDWITNLIGHVSVFPVTIAMIIVSHAITSSAGALWSPPLIFQSGGFVQQLIGLGVIMLIPNIAGSIRERFKATAPGGITGGAVMGAAMRPVGVIGQAMSTGATVKTLTSRGI